jgi:RHS repeat-associated protein
MRVQFNASNTVAHVNGASCAANGKLRCDNAVDMDSDGGESDPTIENVLILNDALVQVRASGSGGWNTLRDYQLSYDQSTHSTIEDQVSGLDESVAGKLNLTAMKVIGDDGTTSLPSRTFAYTQQTNHYEDRSEEPEDSTECGPSWNNGQGRSCPLWAQTYANNSYYLTSDANGLGLAQTYSWQEARSNQHGTNDNNGSAANPFYCDTTSIEGTYPCDEADDRAWSQIVVTQKTASVVRLSQRGQGGSQTSTPVTGTTGYNYQVAYPLKAQPCPDCVASLYWGNQNDADSLSFYNREFMGFQQATVSNPDGSVETHKFNTTEGVGTYDTSQVSCGGTYTCHNDPWWDIANAAHGREVELDKYDSNGTTLLGQTLTSYQATCPPQGVAGSPPSTTGSGNWDGNLVEEPDHGNPKGVCDVETKQVDTYSFDGAGNGVAVPHQGVAYVYDSYGRVLSQTTTSNDGGANGSPTTIVKKTTYIQDDTAAATTSATSGAYLVDYPAFQDTEDTGAGQHQCTYTSYDGHAYGTGQQSGLTLGEISRVDRYTTCGASPSGQVSRTTSYDVYGNPVGNDDADAVAGNTAHLGCTVGSTKYSMCDGYDGTFGSLPTTTTDALNQTTTKQYQAPGSATAAGGFGLWMTATVDPNNQSASFSYDPLGRQTGTALPGEASGLQTVATAYTTWCSGTAAQSPCVEIDHVQRTSATNTVTWRGFYDGLGHLVEVRKPAPGNQDTVTYYYYDPSMRQVFQSVAYLVAAYTGGPGAAAYSIPDSTQAGTTTTYDGLGRPLTSTDALSEVTKTAYSVVCGAPGTGDTACYEQTMTTDPLNHQSASLIDAMRRPNYVQAYTGNSAGTYALYATAKYTFDFLGNMVQILHPDGSSKTTAQYDALSRATSISDPDRGGSSYTYDQDGNPTQSVDARAAAGTVFMGYDGIDRQIWRNTTNSPTGAYDTYTYDSTAGGNHGIGQLTGETFNGGSFNNMSGSHAYTYDGRGQQTSDTLTIGSTSYPIQSSYDDPGSVTSQLYPDGETVTTSYGPQEWLSGVSSQQGSTNTSILSNVTYHGPGGAAQMPPGATLSGSVYTFAASFDLLVRPTDTNLSAGGSTLYDETRTFDGVGNVSTANTNITGSTDNQAFCYDEQNRLTWSGTQGTPPCTGNAIGAGTLTAAQYQQTFGYDNLGRLTSGPLGAYTYGDPAHLHGVTAIAGQYTASYDAVGDMTCRAASSASTCSGTATGAQLTYDNEGALVAWQDKPGTPTSTASDLYDGNGDRVAQQTGQGGSTTTTVYVGDLEEVRTQGTTTTTSTFYYAGSSRIALAVNGVFSYLAVDGLGSTNVSFDANGNGQGAQLYAPYGQQRYSSGTVPTDYGFTGQHSDSLTGLDHFGARYYDPVAAQFTSADTELPGMGYDLWSLSRYQYAGGNPEARTDPSGHDFWSDVWSFFFSPPPPPPPPPPPAPPWLMTSIAAPSNPVPAVQPVLAPTAPDATIAARIGAQPAPTPEEGASTNGIVCFCIEPNGTSGGDTHEFPGAGGNTTGDVYQPLPQGPPPYEILPPAPLIVDGPSGESIQPVTTIWEPIPEPRSPIVASEEAPPQGAAPQGEGAETDPETGLPIERIYEPSGKHGPTGRPGPKGEISPEPTNGQGALDKSTQDKPTSPARTGIDPDTGEVVTLRRTGRINLPDRILEIYHGYVERGRNS